MEDKILIMIGTIILWEIGKAICNKIICWKNTWGKKLLGRDKYYPANPKHFCNKFGHFKKNFAIIEVQEWEGMPNEIEIIEYMESQGWLLELITKCSYGRNLTHADILFRRKRDKQ